MLNYGEIKKMGLWWGECELINSRTFPIIVPDFSLVVDKQTSGFVVVLFQLPTKTLSGKFLNEWD
jgi:hypothetical protein